MNRFENLVGKSPVETELRVIERPIHPDAAIAMAFWQGRPADGIRIGRDLPCRAVARLLSRIAVCEPVQGGGDYRIQLAGGAIDQRLGRSVAGRCLSEVFDEPTEFAVRRDGLNGVIAADAPRMMRIVYRCGSVELLRHEAVALPVTAPNGTDRWALVFALYF